MTGENRIKFRRWSEREGMKDERMKKVKVGERRRYLFYSGGSCERERSQRAACPDPELPGGPPPGPGDRRVVAAASATQAGRIFA